MEKVIEKKYKAVMEKASSITITRDNLGEAAELQKTVAKMGSEFMDKFDAERKRRYDHYQEYQKKYKKFVDLIDAYDKTIRGKMLSLGDNLSETRDFLSPHGISVIDNWKAEIDDKSEIPLEYMTPDMKKLNKVASAMKEELNIPGVKVRNYPYIKIS